jgi:hypothetical protein
MIMLISVLFATAISAMKANSFVEIPSGPTSTTSSNGVDARAEDVADHEYRQHARADRPPELRLDLAGAFVGSAAPAGTNRFGFHAGGVPKRRW